LIPVKFVSSFKTTVNGLPEYYMLLSEEDGDSNLSYIRTTKLGATNSFQEYSFGDSMKESVIKRNSLDPEIRKKSKDYNAPSSEAIAE
jgi:hypothetical protein